MAIPSLVRAAHIFANDGSLFGMTVSDSVLWNKEFSHPEGGCFHDGNVEIERVSRWYSRVQWICRTLFGRVMCCVWWLLRIFVGCVWWMLGCFMQVSLGALQPGYVPSYFAWLQSAWWQTWETKKKNTLWERQNQKFENLKQEVKIQYTPIIKLQMWSCVDNLTSPS